MAGAQEQEKSARIAWSQFIHTRFNTCVSAALRNPTIDRAALLDAELKVALKQLELLALHRNEFMGACRLPPEILCNIFQYSQEDWSPKRTGVIPTTEGGTTAGTRAYMLGWMSLLHTCSYWRKTALESPSLWCTFNCLDMNPRAIPTLLARSQGLPISLHIDHSHTGEAETAVIESWLCKPILGRIMNLSIKKVPDSRLQQWLGCLQYPMPHLRSLTVDHSHHTGSGLAAIPTNILASNRPDLSLVSLHGVAMTWTPTLLPNTLVSLKIAFNDETHASDLMPSMPTAEQFYGTLSSMKLLEVLELHNCFPKQDASSDTMRIDFPDVFRSLSLSIGVDEIIDLFLEFITRVSTPAHTAVDCGIDHPLGFPIDNHIPAILPIIYGDPQGSPYALHLNRMGMAMLYDARPPTTLLQKSIPGALDDWDEYCLGEDGRGLWVSYEHDSNSSITTHLPLLQTTTLQVLTLGADVATYLLDNDAWMSRFASARDVHSLSVYYSSALSLFEALLDIESARSDGASPSFFLFPRLTTIALHKETGGSVLPGDTSAETRVALDIFFVELLQSRKRRGAAIETIMVAKNMADWDIWDRVKDHHLVTLLEFF
ncbi:unnamed protein product [Peniophora sp. CBMAI 1063]|nr:unnamed protein product [Peniophora sp. CBMAI 1063]